MRIAHISDLHIRNFKYREEYRLAFEDLYRQLSDLRPDLVINTGDTVHSKLAVSPELFDDVANHCLRVTEIAPYWLILGNHDLNLKNKARTDAISPIVRALQGRTRHPLRLLESGPVMDLVETIGLMDGIGQLRFWNYDIRGHEEFKVFNPEHINVGLYHGSISGCVTDLGFVMEDGEAEVSRFDQMDYVLMGDIHKRQSFRGGRMQYPGSLIQQNYGEELVKGFLLWDIRSKDDFSVDFHEVKAPGRFYTIQVPPDFDLSTIDVPLGSRIRARVDGELSPSRRIELERALSERFQPLEIITPDSSGENSMDELDIERLVSDRRKMAEDHLAERGCAPEEVSQVLRLFREFESQIDDVGQGRGNVWSLKRIDWDNMMNYGEGNVIDFSRLGGLVGVFAPNASGKSTIFDIILEALFDKVSKEVPRNVDLINDNKDSALMTVEFESQGQNFFIERAIERIHYGQRKLSETKQWGKTTLDFAQEGESLNGTSRPETERQIRRLIGSFDDFVLSTMVTQNPVFGLPGGGDIINCKETDRRKILFKFLDLDIYERVNQLCRDELKGMLAGLKGVNREQFELQIEDAEQEILLAQVRLKETRNDLSEAEERLNRRTQELAQLEADSSIDLLDLDDRVVMLRRNVRRAEESLEKSRRLLADASSQFEKAQRQRPQRPEMDLADLTYRMEQVRSERETARLSLAKQRDALSRGKKALTTLDGVPCEGKFPTCKFISEASEFLNQREIVEASIALQEAATEAANREFSRLENYSVMHRDVLQWEREVAELGLTIQRYEADVKVATAQLQQAKSALSGPERELEEGRKRVDPGIHRKISHVKLEIEKCQAAIREERQSIEAQLRQIGALEAKKASLEEELVRFDERQRGARIHELLAEMTGKGGLPYRILTRVLPLINHEISKILSGVVKFSVFFEDDPDSQSVSLYIRYGDYKSRPLGLGSGAEKFIASLAVRCALLSVSSLPKTDILIIDEGFGKLDPEHLESIQRMFEYLKDAFGTVFIVSHVDFMRDIVDHSIEITSKDGYAHVSVG